MKNLYGKLYDKVKPMALTVIVAAALAALDALGAINWAGLLAPLGPWAPVIIGGIGTGLAVLKREVTGLKPPDDLELPPPSQ